MDWQGWNLGYRGGAQLRSFAAPGRGRGAARLLGQGRDTANSMGFRHAGNSGAGKVPPPTGSLLDVNPFTPFLNPQARRLVKVPDTFDSVSQYCTLIAHNMVNGCSYHPLCSCLFRVFFYIYIHLMFCKNKNYIPSWQSFGTCTFKDLKDQNFKA